MGWKRVLASIMGTEAAPGALLQDSSTDNAYGNNGLRQCERWEEPRHQHRVLRAGNALLHHGQYSCQISPDEGGGIEP
jgi:hypothetical protein